MAITLPSAQNVPTVDPAIGRDPGVNTAMQFPQANPQAFGSDVGAATEQLGAGAANVLARIHQRRSGIARENDDTSYSGALSERLRALDEADDFSETAVNDASQYALEQQQEVLSRHQGGMASREELRARLERRRLAFVDQLAAQQIAAEDAMQVAKSQERLNAVGASVASDPDTVLDPVSAYRHGVRMARDEAGFLGLTQPQRQAFEAAASRAVAQSVVTPMIGAGQYNEARQFLRNPDMAEALTPGDRLDMAQRIQNGERAAMDAQIRIQTAVAVERAKMGARMEVIQAALTGAGALPLQFAPPPPVTVQPASSTTARQGTGGAAPAAAAGGAQPASGGAQQGGQPAAQPGEPLVQQLDENGDPPVVSSPFVGQQGASDDARSVARMLAASGRLMMVGETGLANTVMSQARFIAENSPEMQRERELDKLITPDLAREFGVPLGTTYRNMFGAVPRSEEEQARSISAARMQGRQQIEGEELISFIDEALTVASDLRDEISVDPTLVGLGGSLRATGKNVFGILGDLGFDNVIETARDIADNSDLGIDDAAALFDNPKLSVLDIMQNSLGLIYARLQTPSGRIPVDVIKRSVDDMKLTGLQSSQKVMDRIDFITGRLADRKRRIAKRFGLETEDPGAPDTGASEADLPVWKLDPESGNLVQVK